MPKNSKIATKEKEKEKGKKKRRRKPTGGVNLSYLFIINNDTGNKHLSKNQLERLTKVVCSEEIVILKTSLNIKASWSP